MDWKVVDWQGVTNFEESVENYFGRILLQRRAGAGRQCGTTGERSPPAALEALRHREKAEKDDHEVARRNTEWGGMADVESVGPLWQRRRVG